MIHRSGSLQHKYAYIFGALVGGAVLTTSLAELYGTYDDNQAAVTRLEQAEAQSAATRIEQFLSVTRRDLANAVPVFWAIGGGTLDQRMNQYQALLRQSPAFTEILYINASGREQLRASRLGLNLIGSEIEHAQDPLFITARAQMVAYSPVNFRDGSEPYLTIAQAEAGPNGGVLMAEVNLKFIWDVVSRIRVGQTGRAYVVDADGTLIAHPDISLVLRKTDFSNLPQIRAALHSPTVSSGAIAVDNTGRRVVTAYDVVRPLNWLVFTEQPLEEAFAPVVASILRSLALLVIGLVVALVGSAVAARRMVRPIQALQAGAVRIGQGVLDQRIDIGTDDELETLADEFNGMTVRLRDSYAALERTIAERERHEHELRIARDIQLALLPSEIAAPAGWSISTHYQPAQVVGGDLYDVLPLPDGQLGLVIGDVAGEGVPAALLMATTRTVLRSVVAQGATAPGEVLSRANNLLYPDTPHNLFVTCLFAVLEPLSGRLRYANAGHVAPLRRQARDGLVDQLRARGMPLGLMPGSVYQEKEVSLRLGETVLFYSDGVVEAHDLNREMFDIDRLTAVAAGGGSDGAALIERVLAELGRFTGSAWEQEDDLMLLTLERREERKRAWQASPPWQSANQLAEPVLSTSAAR
ncbi:MAG TPA: SpoIIE family protein phosphatase [Chloroflexota bacterium]|jgi:serine phosphatase RsbU (regulator of sigma subunit)|nr:SpoIIE family protein phosphatase [Chloroflexota bacterium]